MTRQKSSLERCGLVLLAMALFLLAATPSMAAAPAGKKYAVVLVITNPETGEVETERGCAIFGATEWCTENVECGPWQVTEELGARKEFTLSVQLEEQGEVIDGVGYGLLERRGRKSSIGGTFLYTLEGVQLNAGIAGAQTSRSRCLDWAESDE